MRNGTTKLKTKTCSFQNKIIHVYNRSQLQWSVVQEWLYFGDEDPVTFIEVEAISWENPPKWQELPVLPSVHAYCYSSKNTKAHDPMAKYVSVSSENLHEVRIN